ncbi:MAG: alpha-glucan phosphorylase [Candidatus Adiutrix intracellularis]|jgi:starch phosphorylase|nr:MAG: alpha-glucan phosphorylase [Candidatus Adiutrix intracellularis]MDR2827251.1 alpha-glucan family phosphorylase [Candidatus Adiutrix intracellularis]
MKAKQEFKVVPKFPEKLDPLKKMSYNVLFSWQSGIRDLFKRMEPRLWEESGHNPVAFMGQINQKRLDFLGQDLGFMSQLEEEAHHFEKYMNTPKIGEPETCVAYFSAEFGLTTCVPIYSGGLGILAGDHLKSASDLSIPLIGMGLLYQEGYFSQYLNNDGWQMERYPANDFDNMPITRVTGADGKQIKIWVKFKGQPVAVAVWCVQVGRIPLYLLDTDLDENIPEFRGTTAQLYGGDKEMRIRQEIVLGIGGIRALKAIGLTPSVIHMNEGHSAFSALERINLLRKDYNLSFDAAREIVQASTIFTTHTPVPAGNDTFDIEMARAYFEEYAKELGLNWRVLLGYGRINPRDESEPFGVTPLSLRLSAHANGVSRLHGRVSRQMWSSIWPKNPVEDTPIDYVTNGVHVSSWASREIAHLYDRHLGAEWNEDNDPIHVWQQVQQIPLSELWRAHENCRSRLVAYTRRALFHQLKSQGAPNESLHKSMEVLSPDILTIGFARRFATYKRATLLFHDPDRLEKIINNPTRPVQIIIAGKAHPQDNEGKAFIKDIIHLTRERRFQNRIAFLENYNMRIASLLVSGCDVWLNNPRRPLEACGTSGMKALANGVLNLSILDGWWNEGYGPDYGWAIGQGEEDTNHKLQDETESMDLYNLLEKQVAPLFYQRNADGLPQVWCDMMRASIRDLMPKFSSHRMVLEYFNRFYEPSSKRFQNLVKDNFQAAIVQAEWCNKLMTAWNEIKIIESTSNADHSTLKIEDDLEFSARIQLGSLSPDDVTVEAYYGHLDHKGEFTDRSTLALAPTEDLGGDLHIFKNIIACHSTGKFGYTIRVTPSQERLANPFVLGLIHWA